MVDGGARPRGAAHARRPTGILIGAAAVVVVLSVGSFLMIHSRSTGSIHGGAGMDAAENVTGRFGVIATGWFINERCRSLDRKTSDEFDWTSTQADLGVVRSAGMPMALAIQDVSRKSSRTVACGPVADRMVIEALELSRGTATDYAGHPYSTADHRKFVDDNVFNIVGTASLEAGCSLLVPEAHAELASRTAAVEADYAAEFGRAELDALLTRVADDPKWKNSRCEPTVRPLVGSALFAARRMHPG